MDVNDKKVQEEVAAYVNWLLDELAAGRFPKVREEYVEEVDELIGVGFDGDL